MPFSDVPITAVAFPHVVRIWRRWLSRQRRDGTIAWGAFLRKLERYALPPPVAIHSVLRRVASS